MQRFSYQDFITAASPERFAAYRPAAGTDYDALCRYLWNIALCQSLYPALQTLEVTLRNTLQNALSQFYNNSFWFMPPASPLDRRGQQSVDDAIGVLTKEGKPLESGRLVAELNFGFWTSLFNAVYEQKFVNAILKPAFPHMPRYLRTRSTFSKRLNDIRRLRNRVFHHERIVDRASLPQEHAAIVETIAWVSPTMASAFALVDSFEDVHDRGLADLEQRVAMLPLAP